jgi:hypothetical protein
VNGELHLFRASKSQNADKKGMNMPSFANKILLLLHHFCQTAQISFLVRLSKDVSLTARRIKEPGFQTIVQH